MNITIGTAQFGLDYGITNEIGKTAPTEVFKILTLARMKNILALDTAASYGDSEEILGEINVSDFEIYTKTPHFESTTFSQQDIEKLNAIFQQSLTRLKVNRVEGLLLHNVEDCYKKNSNLLLDYMFDLRRQKLVRKIGISIYSPQDIEWILNNNLPLDMIQLPINILDQRLLQTELLTKIKSKGIEVHARSIFLQGILLGEKSQMPIEKYNYVKDYFKDISKLNVTKLEAALLFISQIKDIDNVVLGVNSVKQLEEIIEAYEKVTEAKIKIDFAKYACSEVSIIDPRKW